MKEEKYGLPSIAEEIEIICRDIEKIDFLLETFLGYGENPTKILILRDYVTYQMRQLLLEKQTPLWQDTREESKVNRLMETDEIKRLVEYAKSQGSKNADKYYINFSRLANKAAGVNSKARDTANTSCLNNLALTENIIISVIREGIHRKIPYKSLYQNCKRKVNIFFEV